MVVAAGLTAAAPPAQAQSGADLVQACRDNGGPDCTGIDHLIGLPASVCREATFGNGVEAASAVCTPIDGRSNSSAAVDDYAADAWTPKALAMQRVLDDDNPLQEELWTHTHNSYNSEGYAPAFYSTDPNQRYTLTDQLDMGIRAIELDLHYAPSTSGDPAQNGYAVLVCHGGINQIPGQPVRDHFGCGANDPLFSTRLDEVAAWVKDPGNADEVIILYLENNLADDLRDPAPAFAEVARLLDDELGSLVYKPPSDATCAPFPADVTRGDIREAGKRVLVVGECGGAPAPWRGWVFNKDVPRWKQGGVSKDEPFTQALCDARRNTTAWNYAANWIRHWGDETGLSHGAGDARGITADDASAMVRCGVNMIGLDNLVPDDPRMDALVWSWQTEASTQGGDCAFQNGEGYFQAGDCNKPRKVACQSPSGDWAITKKPRKFKQATDQCAEAGASFAVPRTGYDNAQLEAAKGSGEVWLNYTHTAAGWTPH